MPLDVKSFNFDKSGNNVTPVLQSVTGIGHKPKAYIVWTTSSSSSGPTDGSRMTIGFTDGSSVRSCGWSSADATSSPVASRIDSSLAVFHRIGDAGGTESVADHKSFDPDGFTWNWTTNDTTTYHISGISFGGTDITNVKVGSFRIPANFTGDIDVKHKSRTRMTWLTTRTAAQLQPLAEKILDANDQLIFHCGVGATIPQAYIDAMNAITQVPNSQKGIECFSLADIQANIGTVVAQGWGFMVYDLEGSTGNGPSPDAELADPVQAMEDARQIVVVTNGKKLQSATSQSIMNTDAHAQAIAPKVSWVHLQSQVRQDEGTIAGQAMNDWIRGRVSLLKAANPALEGVSMQVTLSSNIHPNETDAYSTAKKATDYVYDPVRDDPATNPDAYMIWWNGPEFDSGRYESLLRWHESEYSGLPFSPDVTFFMTTGTGTHHNGELNVASSTAARISFGVGTSATRRTAISTVARGGGSISAADTARKQHSTMALTALSTTDPATAIDFEGDYKGPLASNTGFKFNVSNAPSVDTTVFYLAIKGGTWDTGTVNVKTDTTGTQNVPTTMPAKGIIVMSNGTNTDTATAHARFMMGSATSSANQNTIWSGDQDGASPTFTARSSSITSLHRNLTEAGVGSDSVLNAEAALSSFTSTAAVLNWSTVVPAASTYRLNVVVFGDAPGPATTPVSNTFVGKYDILKKISRAFTGKYSMGGKVTTSVRTHDYNILGKVNRMFVANYNINTKVNRSFVGKYNLSVAAQLVSNSFTAKYDIQSTVSRQFNAFYNIAEAPGMNLAGYLKPLLNRIYFMSNNMEKSYHTFNAFDPEESSINVNYCDVNLSSGSAGEFTIRVEDSSHLLDTTEVGNGNAVLIQAAKTEGALSDGKHNLIFGYINDVDTLRPETNVLEYEFHGVGSAIRMTERISNFNRAAARISQNSAEPNLEDPNMQAWRLVQDLMTKTDHLPIGEPLETSFTINGVTSDPEKRVNEVIPSIQEEFAEFSEILNLIADTTGATWGVDYNPNLNDLFLRYAELQPSGIVIKDRIETTDDRFKTAYIQGPWGWNDSTHRSDGFCNRFFAITATKDVLSNVISIPNIADQFTPLCVDSPPNTGSGGHIPDDVTVAVGPVVYITHQSPTSPIWDMIETHMEETPHMFWRIVMKQSPGSTGVGYPTDSTLFQAWNDLSIRLSGRNNCAVICWCDLQNGSKPLATVQAEIDVMRTDGNGIFNFSGAFFENCPTNNLSYVASIADYAITAGMLPVNIVFNTKGVPPLSYFENTHIDIIFVIYEGAGPPNMQNMRNQYSYAFGSAGTPTRPERKMILVHSANIYGANAIWTESDLRTFIRQMITPPNHSTRFCTYSYFTGDDGSIDGYWNANSTLWPAEFDAMHDEAVEVLQNIGYPIQNVPTQQDLGMSFMAETKNLDDFAVIVSKVGNPQPDQLKPNPAVYGEVLDSRPNTRIISDAGGGGDVTVVTTEQPKNLAPIASFQIPFSQIQNQFPTIIFLHGIINKKQDIVVGRRYWVVLYGVGHNESNTVRWHHADNPGFDYLASRRIPAADYRNLDRPWETFSNVTHPGFALSNFRNTTKMMEASEPDSMDHFGIKESPLNLVGIKDDAVAIRTLHSILDKSSKPKRIYDIKEITAPDDLIVPGMLVTIMDSMTVMGSTGGGSQFGTEAEITEARYTWDASQDPSGCRFVQISAVGHVDWQFAYWKAKYDRGEVSFQFPDFKPIPTSPERPDSGAPVVTAIPRGGTFNSPVSVKFVTNKQSVSVFYTTNGNVPGDNVGGGSSVGTTQYIPGVSPDIKINNTTTIRFKGVDDTNGKVSAVYAEDYTIGTVTTPPPPTTGEGKGLFLSIFQDVDVPTAVNIFKQYTRSNLDRVTLHKRIEESLTTTNKNLVKTIPARQYEIEFQAYSQMDSYIGSAKAENFTIIGFNIERDDSPEIDTKDVIGTINKFQNRVNLDFEGLQVKLNPRHDYTEMYGSRVARKSNYYNLQAHTRQGNKENFQAFVKKYAASLRQNNNAIYISVTLSADTDQHDSLPGKNRLETMKDCWQYAKNHVDAVRIFYKTTDQLTSIVDPFLAWFNQTGRRL